MCQWRIWLNNNHVRNSKNIALSQLNTCNVALNIFKGLESFKLIFLEFQQEIIIYSQCHCQRKCEDVVGGSLYI